MMYLSINGTDYSSYLGEDSVQIVDQLQNKSNTCTMALNPGMGTLPSEAQEVLLYDWVEVVSLSSVTLEVKDQLKSGKSILDYGKLRAGDALWIGLGLSTKEKVIISSIAASSTSGQVTITLRAAASSSHSSGEKVGRLIFGGTISNLKKLNPRLLSDIECDLSLTDFTKIFDKRLLNDSWANVDARYIINDALNSTINYNQSVDAMDYANDAAVQAVWTDSILAIDAPPTKSTDFVQGTSAVLFTWSGSGNPQWAANLTSINVSDLTGVNTGKPTKGNLTFWYKRSSATGITSGRLTIGSSPASTRGYNFTLEADTDWHFVSLRLDSPNVSIGTPDWRVMDYINLLLVVSGSGSIIIDDIRITANGSFTMYNFEETPDFEDVRAAFKKPTVFIDQLAKALDYSWYIDYERDIHFFARETNEAPFDIDATSDNYDDLDVSVDTTQVKNRQVVRGGDYTSSSFYSQVIEGDNATREWVLKSKFAELTIKQDNNTSTDTCEAGTTTTNIKATAHGLATGDYIVNRTRSNAVRKITVVDADNFTVEAVTSQTNGDTFSKFSTSKTVGVENLDVEASYDYMRGNSDSYSVRASSQTATLPSGTFLLFTYKEILPVRVQETDSVSVAAMKALVGGDGVFDGAVITDSSLDSQSAARDRAQAEITQFANPIVTITFKTNYEGLKSGQLIHITDSAKGIDDDYLIQKVKNSYKTGDFLFATVTCASTLFGIIEYFQKLSQGLNDRFIDENETIDQIFDDISTITISDSNAFAPSEEVADSATLTLSPSDSVVERNITTSPYKWEPDASDNRWNLAQWG